MDIIQDADGIFSLTLFHSEVAASIVEQAKRIDLWQDGQVGIGQRDSAEPLVVVRPEIRSASMLKPAHAPELFQEFDYLVDNYIIPMVSPLAYTQLTHRDMSQMARYRSGGQFLPHRDAGLGFEDRYMAVLCYLNDDFEGGHTSFLELNYSVVPQGGKVIIFRSDLLHCAERVISGEKYIMTTQLRGAKRLPWL